MKSGEKLLVLTRDGDILLRKTTKEAIEDISHKIEKSTEETIDVDTIVTDAVEWARKSK